MLYSNMTILYIHLMLSYCVSRNRKISTVSGITQNCDICVFQPAMKEAEFYCVKCTMNFCTGCREKHDTQPMFKTHSVVHISNKEAINLYCHSHNKLPCVYFCVDCDVPVCMVCLLLSHHGHHSNKLRDTLAQRRDSLRIQLNTFGSTLEKLDNKLKKLANACTAHFRRSKNGSLTSVRDSPRFVRTASGKEAQLRHHDSSPKLNISSIQRKRLSVSEASKMMSASSNGGSPGTFRQRMCSTPDSPRIIPGSHSPRAGEGGHSNGNPPDYANPQTESAMRKFQAHRDRIRKLFDLSTKILEMSQSNKLLAIYEDIVARINTVLQMEVAPLEEEILSYYTKEVGSISDIIGQMPAGTPTPLGTFTTSPFRLRAGSGSSSSTVTIEDRDESLLAEDEHLEHFMLIKPKLLWKVEKQGSDLGELYNPCDVAFLSDRELIVAEYDVINDKNNRLRVLNQEGKTDHVIAQGSVKPLGVAVSREGKIVVTDCKDKRVKVMNPDGSVVLEVGKGHFGWPYGVAVNSKGQLIVTDAFSDTVSIFSMDGKKVTQFGSSGNSSFQFRNPFHVTVDNKDNIIVSDSGNNCVKLFDSTGQFLHKTNEIRRKPSLEFGNERRLKKKRLKGPRGICTDIRGEILVADDRSRICLFDGSGQYIRNLLTEEDTIKYPEALACSPTGLLAVTEWNPNNMFAIKMFNLYDS